VVVAAARHAGDVSATEQALHDLVATMPPGLDPAFLALYRLGALWAVGLVVAAALIARRARLARDLLVAGAASWLLARILGDLVGTGGVGVLSSFPAVRVAVVAAIISAAGPYVTRPTRVVGRVLVVAVALAAVDLGRAGPNDVLAAVVLGWAVAAGVHLAFGSPGGRPSVWEVSEALTQLGFDGGDVRLADVQPTGSTLMFAGHGDTLVRVKVIGRDEVDARLLVKLWRTVLYVDSGPPVTITRLHQLEREAYLMLRAREAGTRVPPVLGVGSAGHGSACLVVATVDAVPLLDVSRADVTDALLEDCWHEVLTLHEARIAHGLLDAAHVVVSPAGPWIVGFDAARSTIDEDRFSADVAAFLVATSSIVGDERAIRVAARSVGHARLARALPFLQTVALPGSSRHLLATTRSELSTSLDRLRELGASTAGVAPPEVVRVRRLDPTSIAMALGALVAAIFLLNQVGDPGEMWATVRNAEWGWILLAFVYSFASNVGFAIGLMGTVPITLPLWPTTELQIAMSFSNLAVPAVGGQGMQVRFLQKRGVDLSSAVAAGGILSIVGNLIAAAALFVLAVVVEPSRADFSLLPASGLLELTVIVVAVVAVASVVVLTVPRVRRVTAPQLRRALSTARTVVRSPRKLTLLVGGNALALALSTACLAACLLAFGGAASFWSLLAANIGVMTVASTVPLPGGGTAVGTVGLSAVLVSFGVPEHVAVATVLANQLTYYYLPAIPGWFATRHLLRHDYL
jgi:undecaprenyl-diphosphatase